MNEKELMAKENRIILQRNFKILKKKKYCNQKHIFTINTIKQNWV